jgi:predicted enzyme related to lactoylglutathione lyase
MRFGHTNLIARDWRRLADFHISVFGCTSVPPERDLRADWLDRATGIAGAHITGIHGPLTWAYVRDPEGNIIELQHWGSPG